MHKIAVFFDADNIGADYVSWVLDDLKKLGEIYIIKVFGDIPARKGWVDFAKENAIQAFHVPKSKSKSKNASDIALTIEVMKTLESQAITLFAIASSDSDFSALALAIKERGHKIIGFGKKENSNERGRNSFSEYHFLPALAENEKTTETKTAAEPQKIAETKTAPEPITTPPKPAKPKTVAAPPKPTLPKKLTQEQFFTLWLILNEIFIAQKYDLDDKGFMLMSTLGTALKQKTTCKSFGYKMWSDLFKKNPELGEYKIIGKAAKFKLATKPKNIPLQKNEKNIAAPQEIAETHKLTPQQLSTLRQNLNKIYIAKNLNTNDFIFTGILGMFLAEQKLSCKDFGYKNWNDLFKENPELGEYKNFGYKWGI